MKALRFLLVLVCLFLYSPVYSPVQGGKKRYNFGKEWNRWNDHERYVYLRGLRDGMDEGKEEWYWIGPKIEDTEANAERYAERYEFYMRNSITQNFPNMEAVREIMTDFYADPSNTYLHFVYVLKISVAKLRGSSLDVIERLLATARKQSHDWHQFLDYKSKEIPPATFRMLFEKEVYRIESDTRETIESFRQEIQEHEDQLFGITLFFEGIKIVWADHEEILEMNRIAVENIMQRGNAAIKQAKRLLHEAEKDPSKIERLQRFQFPPIHGDPILEGMSERGKILVETYNELFPGRPRTDSRTQTEIMLLMERVADKL